MKNLVLVSSILLFWAATATAEVVLYSTSFTSADGFTEAGNLHGTDGWSAQNTSGSALQTVNVNTNGEVRSQVNFLRGFVAGTSFAVGETLKITADVKSLTGATPGFDANILHIGLTNNTNLGTSSSLAGGLLGASNTGGVFRLASQSNLGRTDSILIDSDFHSFSTSVTKTATANVFDVTSNFAGTEISYSVTNADLYNASTVYSLAFTQGQSNVGGIALDSFTVTRATAVPEPSSLGAIAILGSLFAWRRRPS